MKLTDLEHRIHDTAWPALSSDLRARVLAEATVVAPAITWSDRVWFSRSWRLGLAAAALALVAINHLSTSGVACCAAGATLTQADADEFVETSVASGMPADVANAIARRSMARARPSPHSLGALPEIGDDQEIRRTR